MAQLVKYSDFTAENVDFTALTEQKSKNNAAAAFKTSKLSYKLKDGKQELLIEGSECYSSKGLTEKLIEGTDKKTYAIYSQVNKGDKNQMAYANCLVTLNKRVAEWMVDNVDKYKKMATKNRETALESALGDLRGLSFDGKDDDAIYIAHTCFNYGSERTLFVRPKKITKMVNGKLTECVSQETVPWSLVMNSEIRYIPLLRVKDVFIGTVNKIRAEMVSAVITDIKPRGSSSMQTDTLEEIYTKRPETISELDDQIAKLMAMKQGLLQAGPVVDEKGIELSSDSKKTALAQVLGGDDDDGDNNESSNKRESSPEGDDEGEVKRPSPPKSRTLKLKKIS